MTHRRPRAAAIVLAVLLPLALAGCTVIDGSSGDATPYASPARVIPLEPDATAVDPTDPLPAPTPSTSSPTPSDASTLPPAVTLATGPTAAFVTPTGDITCVMTRGSGPSATVRCDVRDATYDAPGRPSDCHGDWGPTVELGESAGFVCVFDSINGLAAFPQRRPPSWMLGPYDAVVTADGTQQAVLGDGHSLAMGTVRCTSEGSGVRCLDTATGAAVVLSRSAATFTQATRSAPGSNAARLPGGFVGSRVGIGGTMDVLADGEISVRYRTEWCDNARPPCDEVYSDIIAPGASIVLQATRGSGGTTPPRLEAVVVTSNEQDFPPGTQVELALDTATGTVSTPFGPYCPASGKECQG
ncbi:hypothetical protein [Lapillicoccus jejuensis]|uniref:Uncharacterized protein n=1 Tax=Lapillicoccus jejuensis TaxID=402171 RepID=A0A542E3K8_9MICO|nr:hypothetical protein [Lapillicoccus jejuensis]TQJ09932.1 hypothetical protein FB458_3048 [Lapillicoccus jejuensis]